MNDIREILNEGLSDAQAQVYSDYAQKLRRVESADLLFGELMLHQQAIQEIGEWLQAGVAGADVMGGLIADHRRKRDLCQNEINRRDRAGKFPPGGVVVHDLSDAKRSIKEKTVEIIESYGIALKKRGKELFGLCPFHDDHNPSMRVNPVKLFWYCDPCGFGGDIFDFIARMERGKNGN